MRDFLEIIAPVVLAAILMLVLALVLTWAIMVGPANAVAQRECEARASEIGFPYKYDFWGGCRIEVEPGRWIPLESYFYEEE